MRILGVLAFCIAGFAQTCPVIDFLNAREFAMYGNGVLNAPFVRRSDASYTLQPHNYSPPFARLAAVPNAQNRFSACLPAPRTSGSPLPVRGRPLGEGSTDSVLFRDVGNGIAGAAWVAFTGQAVQVFELNSDLTYKARTDYTVGQRTGLVPGDFNGDGKPDIAVLGVNAPGNDGFVAVMISKGDGTYNQPVKSPTGATFPVSAAAGDFDRDGKLDLVVAQNSGLFLLRGAGNGTFQAATSIRAGSGFGALSSADWNGDRIPDLAATSFTNNGEVFVFLGNGDGSFRVPIQVPATVNPLAVTSGDFNKDGRNDLAVSGILSLAVMPGNGDGTFGTARHYLLGHKPQSLVVVDFNHDGNLDIVAGEGSDEALVPVVDTGFMAVLLGNGDGTFIGAPMSITGPAQEFAVADFNGDGRMDAVTANFGNATLLMGAAGGGFEAPRTLTGAAAVAIGDFNGDGRMDIALGDSSSNGVLVHLGIGNGTFQNPLRFPARNRITGLAAGDWNGDGRTDLAAVFSGTSTGAAAGVLPLLQRNGTLEAGTEIAISSVLGGVVAADLTGDGRMDLAVVDVGVFGSQAQPGGVLVLPGRGDGGFQSPVRYVAGINPNSVQVGDLNGDGRKDLVITTNGPSFSFLLAVVLGRADGTLGTATLINTDFGPVHTAIADFNGDGRQDIIVAHCCGETDATYLLGNGDGTFQPEVHFSGGANPSRLGVADLNADGKPDLMVLNTSGGSAAGLSVLLNISAAPPAFVSVSAASADSPVAPDSFVSSYGENLAPSLESAQSLPLPQTLAGITVKVMDSAGVTRNAAMHLASPGQVNFVMPAGAQAGTATVSIGASNPKTATVEVARVAPGLFQLNAAGLAAAQVVRVSGSAQTVEDVFMVAGGQVVARPIDFGGASDQLVLLLYGTGIRNRLALSDVRVTAGGVVLALAYAGPHSTYPALDQINATLPRTLQGRGPVDVVLTVEGKVAKTVKLEFR